MYDYTPIMKQYRSIKKANKDKIILFRVGDFYELFFKDALECSELLLLRLTSRGKYKNKNIPMCGFPHNSINHYITKLMQHGKHVAVCDQINKITKNGLIDRKITNIFTPGTFVYENYLKDCINNYITCIYVDNNIYGIACIDIRIGYFFINQVKNITELQNEIDKINPTEILISDCFNDTDIFDKKIYIQKIKHNKFNYASSIKTLKHILSSDTYNENMLISLKIALTAGGYLLEYISKNQNNTFKNINSLEIYNLFETLYLDKNTRKNLELFTSNSGDDTDSLFNTINLTTTPMGKRMFRRWLNTPLISSSEKLKKRVKTVSILKDNKHLLDNIITHLKNISDLDKILFNIIKNNSKPHELKRLEQSLNNIAHIKNEIKNFIHDPLLKEIYNNINDFTQIINLIKKALNDNVNTNITDGNFIKDFFDKKIDHYRFEIKNITLKIKNYQEKEQKNITYMPLKISSNKSGYFIILPKKLKVPEYYKKIKELSTSIYYITDELKYIETINVNYNDLLLKREIKIYNILCYTIKKQIKNIQYATKYISILDVIKSFASISYSYSWCEQQFVDFSTIQIKNGRHPTLELKNISTFIPNDTYFDTNTKTYIITGANMGGKSTYMRQIALITLLAHIGSHVPADEVIIGHIDKIFTRIGASDDITNSLSTFMLEMTEMSDIIIHSTAQSLVLIDEIGRGTNYLEGKALALSILSEFIIEKKSFLLFATHFHDLSHISALYSNVKSIYFKVINKKNKLIFFYKYFNGISKKGFALNVAKTAGIPNKIILRSHYYLTKFRSREINQLNLNINLIKLKRLQTIVTKNINSMKDILYNLTY